jgi:hypothetical protein
MAISRYNKTNIISVDTENDLYRSKLEKRDIKQINAYSFPVYNFDDTKSDVNFSFKEEVWKEGDRLYKLSKKHYNSVEYWWVIAFFNQKPTDSDFSAGDLVLIPYPLQEAIEFIGVM